MAPQLLIQNDGDDLAEGPPCPVCGVTRWRPLETGHRFLDGVERPVDRECDRCGRALPRA